MYIDHCSNPTRYAHGDSLTPIPNEIYFKIFSYVAPMDEGPSERESRLIRSTLMKVCRLFYAELLARVFESVEFAFSPPRGFPRNDPQLPKSVTLCEELNKDGESLRSLTPYITTCTVGEIPYFGRNHRRDACTKIYSQAILRLANLESLSLFSVHIDAKIFEALEVLKSLKKLWIKDCSFKAAEIPLTMQPLNLTDFGISFTDSAPEVLLDAVSSPSLRVLEVDDGNAFYALYFVRRPIKWHLEQLSVPTSVTEHTEFSTFLDNTPSIRTLCIGTDVRGPPYISGLTLQPSSLPKLECLKCYPIALPRLIPGRAVNHIQVFHQCGSPSCPPLQTLEITALKQSAPYLETLQISLSYMKQLVDGEHFRHLQTLIIEYDRSPGSINVCLIPMLPKLPRLRDLTLDRSLSPTQEFDLRYQHNVIIADIVPKVPEITSVTLTSAVCWHRTDHWYPIIPPESRENVRYELLRSPMHHVVDFGGLFASLFRPEELTDALRWLLFRND